MEDTPTVVTPLPKGTYGGGLMYIGEMVMEDTK